VELNMHRILLTALILSIAILSSGFPQEEREANGPFFAMDTNLRDGSARTPEQTAALLKKLGFDGYGHGGTADIPAWLAALDRHGLRMFTTYVGMNLDDDFHVNPSLHEAIRQLEGRETMVWLYVQSRRHDRAAHDGDEVAVAAIRSLADFAHEHGVKIALYPHTGFYVESCADALRIAEKVNRRNVGISLNLCHWLKIEGDRPASEFLTRARSYLFRVSINGADGGDTRGMGWDRLIQPLDRGSYDVQGLLRALGEAGYRGPIGLQGYGIAGDAEANLRRSIAAWKRFATD
jgi:sugar phosphate isomerase/epimerase